MKVYSITFLLLLLTIVVRGQLNNKQAKAELENTFLSLRSQCSDVAPNKMVEKKRIKQDKITIDLINTLYYNDFAVPQIENLFSKVYKRNWQFKEITQFEETTLYRGFFAVFGNLEFRISVATINNEVVSKKFWLRTKTRLVCKTPDGWPDIDEYDIPYLLKYFLPFIKPLIHLHDEYPEIVIDTTLTDKLDKISPKYRSLLTGDSARFFNNLTWHVIDTYSKPNSFLQQYGLTSPETLEKLLFSPNHIIAIYAYEILKDYEGLSQETINQMNRVLNSPIKIKWMFYDSGHYGLTYKELMHLK